MSSEKKRHYQAALTELVAHILEQLLVDNKQISPTNLVGGTPALHRQMQYVYQHACLFKIPPAPEDYALSIPRLIKAKDIDGLVQLIIETKDIDLTTEQVAPSYLSDYGKPSLAFLFLEHPAVRKNLLERLTDVAEEHPHVNNVIGQLRHDHLSLAAQNGQEIMVGICLKFPSNYDLVFALEVAQQAGHPNIAKAIASHIEPTSNSIAPRC